MVHIEHNYGYLWKVLLPLSLSTWMKIYAELWRKYIYMENLHIGRGNSLSKVQVREYYWVLFTTVFGNIQCPIS